MLHDQSNFVNWKMFLSEENKKELLAIEEKIGDQFTPARKNVLRFLSSDLSKIKVCIVGQDPYPSLDNGVRVANGRSFQPDNLKDWSQIYRQISLKNIIRLIHKTYNHIEAYGQIKKYKDIVTDINLGHFKIKPPKEWFDSLEQQGVLFLNRYLTTEIGRPKAHRKIWDAWTSKLFRYIDEQTPGLTWLLWGQEAQECIEFIGSGTIFKSRHPMMCSNKYDDDFLKADYFEKTMNIINWLG